MARIALVVLPVVLGTGATIGNCHRISEECEDAVFEILNEKTGPLDGSLKSVAAKFDQIVAGNYYLETDDKIREVPVRFYEAEEAHGVYTVGAVRDCIDSTLPGYQDEQPLKVLSLKGVPTDVNGKSMTFRGFYFEHELLFGKNCLLTGPILFDKYRIMV